MSKKKKKKKKREKKHQLMLRRESSRKDRCVIFLSYFPDKIFLNSMFKRI